MMRILLILAAVLAVSTALPTNTKKRYDNYKVYSIVPQTAEEVIFLKNVGSSMDKLDFWTFPGHIGKAVDVMVSPSDQTTFLTAVARAGLVIDTKIPDVQQLIDEETAKMAVKPDVAWFDYYTYHTMAEINTWMDAFVAENVGVTKVQVTTTFLGEAVYGLRFHKQIGTSNVAYIQGGIHAREWISPATMINFARQFSEGYGIDTTITAMLDNFIWYIVPVYNIDGYRFSHTDDRMWRKNRNDNGGAACKGVDLNRNFPYQWGGAGKSQCVEDYEGTHALSEPENSGAKAFLDQFGTNLKVYIDFHSYGQYWLYPWGYSRLPEENFDKAAQHDVAIRAEAAIFAVHGKHFIVGESGPDMYPATGASEDFGYGTMGAKYTYVVELRDEGQFGFLLPEIEIKPVAEEMIEGLKEVGKQIVLEF